MRWEKGWVRMFARLFSRKRKLRGMEARRGESGQMAVELAVALPVLLVAMVIAADLLVFMGECARFDHLAAQAVLAQGTSPGKAEYAYEARAANVQHALEDSFKKQGMSVRVSTQEGGGFAIWKTCTFTCTFEMAPWPFRQGSLDVFGAGVPLALTHDYSLTVEAYTPGKLL